jgi:hypothetical protein
LFKLVADLEFYVNCSIIAFVPPPAPSPGTLATINNRKMPLLENYKKALFYCFILVLLCIIISVTNINDYISHNVEAIVQCLVLSIGITIYSFLEKKKIKNVFIDGIIITFLFSIILNVFNNFIYPSSELSPVRTFFFYLLTNNYLILVGVIISFINLYLGLLIKRIKNHV